MHKASTLIGCLLRKGVKIEVCRKEDSVMINSVGNENLTEDGVYAYEVHDDWGVDIYGSYGFMIKKGLQENERKKLEYMDYMVRSIRP
jgi:hypothetical protein